MIEDKLIKKIDSKTKNKLISILNSKTLDSDEIKEKFEIEIDNYIYDNDLEDFGIEFESLDMDYLITYFMQFLKESVNHQIYENDESEMTSLSKLLNSLMPHFEFKYCSCFRSYNTWFVKFVAEGRNFFEYFNIGVNVNDGNNLLISLSLDNDTSFNLKDFKQFSFLMKFLSDFLNDRKETVVSLILDHVEKIKR